VEFELHLPFLPLRYLLSGFFSERSPLRGREHLPRPPERRILIFFSPILRSTWGICSFLPFSLAFLDIFRKFVFFSFDFAQSLTPVAGPLFLNPSLGMPAANAVNDSFSVLCCCLDRMAFWFIPVFFRGIYFRLCSPGWPLVTPSPPGLPCKHPPVKSGSVQFSC